MLDINLWALFLAGLLGGGHCVGMCGGIVSALTLHLPANVPRYGTLWAYNLGRLSSYVVIGTLLGALAASGFAFIQAQGFQLGLSIFANIMLIFMGLYLAGISSAISFLEKLGTPLWRHLQKGLGKLLPIRSLPAAFAAGIIWGWLPCGLVYSASLSALASGQATQGGLIMLAFGLGTLPNLLLMGVFADTVRRYLQTRSVRLFAGLLVVAMGGWRLWGVLVSVA